MDRTRPRIAEERGLLECRPQHRRPPEEDHLGEGHLVMTTTRTRTLAQILSSPATASEKRFGSPATASEKATQVAGSSFAGLQNGQGWRIHRRSR